MHEFSVWSGARRCSRLSVLLRAPSAVDDGKSKQAPPPAGAVTSLLFFSVIARELAVKRCTVVAVRESEQCRSLGLWGGTCQDMKCVATSVVMTGNA